MNTAPIPISVTSLIIAAGLVLVSGSVSVGFRLGLERSLAVASVRTVVQLLLVGYVLRWVFGLQNAYVVLCIAGLMLLAASRAAVQRSSRTFRGANLSAFATLTVTGLLTTFTVTHLILGVEPWYLPQYVIPLLGMILGNGLTGISLCLDHALEGFANNRHLVEMELAHGATRWEAARDTISSAVRRGMIPIINSMTVVGIVSLPGMMTGQILAGTDPLLAVKYQIVVMFMVAASTSVGCMLLSLLIYRHLFNDRHQLLTERIWKR